KAHEEEARSRRQQVSREGRHELEETHEEEAAQEQKVGWVVDVRGEVEGPGTREKPHIGHPGGDQGKTPREITGEEDEPGEGENVQCDQRRLGFSRENERQADQERLQRSGNLPGDHVGAEEGPLAGGEELEPEEIDLDIIISAQLETQAVVDPD